MSKFTSHSNNVFITKYIYILQDLMGCCSICDVAIAIENKVGSL